MTRSTGFVCALALCWLGLAMPALAQRLPEQQQQQAQSAGPISVPAGGGWVRAGLVARKGGQLQIIVARDGRRAVQVPGVTAQRAPTPAPSVTGVPDTRGPLLQTANAGAVIARIGDNAPFLVGRGFGGTASADGELWLAINDASNQRTVQGAVLILARATPPPTTGQRQPPQSQTPTAPPATTQPPATQPPPQRPPPNTAPPTAPPPAQTPPTRAPPVAAPPVEEAPPVTSAPREPETPLAEPAPAPEAAPPVAAPPSEQVRVPLIPPQFAPYLIGGAALAGLLLLLSLFRPSRKVREAEETVAGAVIGTRVVRDGVAGQTLVIKERRR